MLARVFKPGGQPMSYQMVSRVLEHSQAKGPARTVLMVLAHHDFGNGDWLIDQKQLAREAGVSRRTAQRALDDLQVLGEIGRVGETTHRRHFPILLECPEGCEKIVEHCFELASERRKLEANMRQSDARHASERRNIKGSERTSSPKKEKRWAAPVRQEPDDPADPATERRLRDEELMASVQSAIQWEVAWDDVRSSGWVDELLAVRSKPVKAKPVYGRWLGAGRGSGGSVESQPRELVWLDPSGLEMAF
jgi:hypothetical protein